MLQYNLNRILICILFILLCSPVFSEDKNAVIPSAIVTELRQELLRVIGILTNNANNNGVHLQQDNWKNCQYHSRLGERQAVEVKWANGMSQFDYESHELVELQLSWPKSVTDLPLTQIEIENKAQKLLHAAFNRRTDLIPTKLFIQDYDNSWLVAQSFELNGKKYFLCGITALFDKFGRVTNIRVSWPYGTRSNQIVDNIGQQKAIMIAENEASKISGFSIKSVNSCRQGFIDFSQKGNNGKIVCQLAWHVIIDIKPQSDKFITINCAQYYISADDGKILLRQQ